MSIREDKVIAMAVLALALASSIWLGIRWMKLRGEAAAAAAQLDQARNASAEATLNSMALPANGKLSVCNDAHDRMQITALAGVYTDAHGALRVFNSAKETWRTWEIAPGAESHLTMQQDGAGWDGQALFYAMDVAGAGGEQMLAGTTKNLISGCIALSGKRSNRKN